MKTRYLYLLPLLAGALLLGSCSAQLRLDTSLHPRSQQKKVPPGQAKKMTGSQSAAPYAPGHNK